MSRVEGLEANAAERNWYINLMCCVGRVAETERWTHKRKKSAVEGENKEKTTKENADLGLFSGGE